MNNALTVAALREALAGLPDDAVVLPDCGRVTRSVPAFTKARLTRAIRKEKGGPYGGVRYLEMPQTGDLPAVVLHDD